MLGGYTIRQIASTLLKTRRAWWLGAGASFSAGVPTVIPLRASILHGLGMAKNDVALLEEKEIPFEGLFEVLLNNSDCTSLMQVFRGKQPSLAHIFLARLAEYGLVETVITTNFDTLIEDAFSERGIQFDLYSTDESLTSINWSDDRVRIIKLHGSIDIPGDLAVTIRRVAARRDAEQRGEVIRQLFEHESKGGTVILGYSCSDHFDLSPAARRYARADRCVWYVAHDATVSKSVVVAPLAKSHPSNPFSGYAATSVTCMTDDLLCAMWRIIFKEQLPPHIVRQTLDWQKSVDSWIEELSSRGGGQTKYIAGLALKAGNLWERSNVYLIEAVNEGLDQERHSRALLAIGNNLRDLGKREEARRILSEAELLARESSLFALQARILNSQGIIAADIKELSVAIELYERALAIQSGDLELEGKCHGNIGIALKNRNTDGDLDSAINHQEAALKVAKEIGDKRSEGRTLGNIGLIYRLRGDINSSCSYYRKARNIADSLGDHLHVAIWLHNEGEDMALTDPDTAKSLVERARDIFKSLGQLDFAEESCKVIADIDERSNKKSSRPAEPTADFGVGFDREQIIRGDHVIK